VEALLAARSRQGPHSSAQKVAEDESRKNSVRYSVI
jgi:hypothetical protein